MDINLVYLKFLDKVNKNSTNDNIVADRARFVIVFNEVQNRYVEWILEKRNEDDIRHIQQLLVPDKKLVLSRTIKNHCDFKLPDNYFEFENVQIFAKTKSCPKSLLHSHEVKGANISELWDDAANIPSFPYRETFYTIADNHVNVYFNEFECCEVCLTYYRYPKQIDIEGYTKYDKTQSSNCDPEWDDRVINRILNAVTQQFHLNTDNLQRIQFDKDSIFSKV